ncbi:hypothetical protein H4S06_001510 [Coemansia sp. BCRC 34490]|nr:hypothetical protein H4S06_001510 [Coemansia sp. BCRC 34490]
MEPNPTTTFTFFRKGWRAKRVWIYAGDYDKIPTNGGKTGADTPPYTIGVSGRSMELIQNKSAGGTHTVLTCKYEGFARHKALIRSDHGITSTERNGLFSSGWKFVYMSTQYKWSVPMFSSVWILCDAGNREIARFHRNSFRFRRIGRLEIYSQQPYGTIDPDFVAMIMATCKLVHNTVKNNERSASS